MAAAEWGLVVAAIAFLCMLVVLVLAARDFAKNISAVQNIQPPYKSED